MSQQRTFAAFVPLVILLAMSPVLLAFSSRTIPPLASSPGEAPPGPLDAGPNGAPNAHAGGIVADCTDNNDEDGGASGARRAVGGPPFSPGSPAEPPELLITCVPEIADQSSAACIQASSTPMLGLLYPISANLFVAVSGDVGIGTTSPTARLHVAGTARVTDTLTLEPAGDQALNVSTGSIYKGGALFIHTNGGSGNTAIGRDTLSSVASGRFNTASGSYALRTNFTGEYNTANGYSALRSNTFGSSNTANGASALRYNTLGEYNTASGNNALRSNTLGTSNTASGSSALRANTTGISNTASGSYALRSNTNGSFNTASGNNALRYNTYGQSNTAIGNGALRYNTTGSRNIGIGNGGGSNLTTGNDNIALGNIGVAGEATTIRIGTGGTHTRAFLAGIRGVTTGVADAIPVLIDSAGQLGTVSSSRRFKEDIADMGERTDRLLGLRPVVFRYKPEVQSGERPLEYGLIAEEVAEIFPELVVHGEDGKPLTVKYHLLSTMLLNELQKLSEKLETREGDSAREIDALSSRLAALEEQLATSGFAAAAR